MSGINEARAIRYLLDALSDKQAVEILIENAQYTSSLFHIEQLCEKASKSSAVITGYLPIKEHQFSNFIIEDVIPESGELEKEFTSQIRFLREIESYYISTRYGVDTHGRISLNVYDQKEVRRLFSQANDYLELCFKFLENKICIKLPRTYDELVVFFKTNYLGFITK